MNVKVSATLALLLFFVAAASCERTPVGAGVVVRLGGEQRVRPALVAAKPLIAQQKPQLTAAKATAGSGRSPSFWWALLANWLYFMSLGLSIPNLPYVVGGLVNPLKDGAVNTDPTTPAAIRVSGDIEALDQALTFLGVGLLGALSDVVGRKPLMAWSALGFGCTCLIQGTAGLPLWRSFEALPMLPRLLGSRASVATLFVADAIDGVSSCMSNVAQAYVADVSPKEKAAINLGIFQGLSIGGAFVFAFPIGGILGAKKGPRVPILAAAVLQSLNFLIITFVMPEPLPPAARANRQLDLREANPVGALRKLFGRAPFVRDVATVYALVTLARHVLDAQFTVYARYKFGWSQQQSGPLLVLVGLMLAIAPRVVVPRLGLRRSITGGTLVFAAGLLGTAFAATAPHFFAAILVAAVGCACIPALVAVLTSQTAEGERGALLGGLASVDRLLGTLGTTGYARLFAYFISDAAPFKLPGAHFVAAAGALAVAFGVAVGTFATHGAAHGY